MRRQTTKSNKEAPSSAFVLKSALRNHQRSTHTPLVRQTRTGRRVPVPARYVTSLTLSNALEGESRGDRQYKFGSASPTSSFVSQSRADKPDFVDDDLQALRSAVLASMKNYTAEPLKLAPSNEDEELAALREAALKSAHVVTPPSDPTAVIPPHNPAIKFVGDSKSDASPIPPLTTKSGCNLIVIATKEEEPPITDAPGLPSKLIRPQDKFCSNDTSASSTPTRPKVSNKFDRFESSESDSDISTSSSSSADERSPLYQTNVTEPAHKTQDDALHEDTVFPEQTDDVIQADVSVKGEDLALDQDHQMYPKPSPKPALNAVTVALEDIPIPETIAEAKADNSEANQSDSVSSSSDEESRQMKTASLTTSTSNSSAKAKIENDLPKSGDGGFDVSDSCNSSLSKPLDAPTSKSIFDRLGNKNTTSLKQTDTGKKDMPIQKSSLLYDIISKKSPGLLMKCKSGNEIEYRRSKDSSENIQEGEKKKVEMTEREQIILEARRKKFGENKPVDVVKKTLSLKSIFRKHSEIKSKRKNLENSDLKEKSRENSVDAADSEHGNSKSDKKSSEKHQSSIERNRNDNDNKDDGSELTKKDKQQNQKKEMDVSVDKHRKHVEKQKNVCESKSDDPKSPQSERLKKKRKSQDRKGKADKTNVLSDSATSAEEDGVSWRFHHTGRSSKITTGMAKKSLFERQQEDMEKDRRKRHVDLPKSDQVNPSDSNILDDGQKMRRTSMHPFRLNTIRLNSSRLHDDRLNSDRPDHNRSESYRSDNRSYDYQRNRAHDRLYSRRNQNFDQHDERNSRNNPEYRKRRNFVEEDDNNTVKNTAKVTSVITSWGKSQEAPKTRTRSLSVSDSSPERDRKSHKSKRIVHVAKSHDRSHNSDSQGMTVSLKRKQRQPDAEESHAGSSDCERRLAKSKSTAKSSTQGHKSHGKAGKEHEDQKDRNKNKKHKKKSKHDVTKSTESEAKLDARIQQIQQNNAAILKRRQVIMEDRKRYG